MSYSVKCQHCNNKTKSTSGLCHLHQNGSPRIPSGGMERQEISDSTKASIDNINRVAAEDKLADFSETELADHFDPYTLEVTSRNQERGSLGYSGFGTVEEPFSYEGEEFEKGDYAFIDLDSNKITRAE